MPPSVRERVIAALVSRLETVTLASTPGAVAVYRGRRKPVPEGRLPALVVQVSGGPGEPVSAAVVRSLLTVEVTGHVKADTDADLDRCLADMATAIQAAVEADPTLGGLAVDTTATDLRQDAANDDGLGGVGEVLAVFTVEFWTRPGDPTALAP